MDKRTDGQTDDSDFIGRCPTNVEGPINNLQKVLKIDKRKSDLKADPTGMPTLIF